MFMPKRLDEYSRKRNFKNTAEPEGGTEESEEHLRFVVQHHTARRDHFDFRLEWNGSLLSWAVPKGPSFNTCDRRLAVQVEDHPLEYRNFEGTIPKGEYGGGVVMLWDEGYWEPQEGVDVDEGLRDGSLKFILTGRRLKGKWALIRMKAKEGGVENNWLLLKEKDYYAKTSDGASEFTVSIRSGRTMAEIEEGEDGKIMRNPFNNAHIQLAKLVNTAPEGDDWLYELKYDGYRIIAYMEGNNAKLLTRNSNDYTGRFQDITDSLADWAGSRAMILDGEMVVTDSEGRTDFQALQSYMKNPTGKNLSYIVFDLLALDGTDLRGLTLIERKEMLEQLMMDSPDNLQYSPHVRGKGRESFIAACNGDFEGIVGKKADSVYSGTRNGDWIKIKCDTRHEFVIGGYTLSDKKTSGVSSILLGVYEGKELVYAGRAGTGFSAQSMKELEKKFRRIIRQEPPFTHAPRPRKNEKITWLKPELVAEIKYAGWTDDHQLRQASFKGLRADKEPWEIKRGIVDDETQSADKPNEEYEHANSMRGSTKSPSSETAARTVATGGKGAGGTVAETAKSATTSATSTGSVIINGIRITSPDKMIFEEAEITKADVAMYYNMVSERMMPYAGHRILSIVRCPKGVSGSCFYKKHPGPDQKGIVTIPVLTGSGEVEDYFYIDKPTGLISEAQMGTVEFHIWGSRTENLEKPDLMVFDLDPDEGMDLKIVRQGVKDIKSVLEELSLVSYLKTSGGKGYHVVVPFKPYVGWDVFYDFARRIAEVMEQKWPERYTSNIRKNKRTNRIFIDWIRNGRGATSIAPYSIRARKGARVSMPITWKELDTVAPDGVDITDALIRISGEDPWSDFFQSNQRLR